MATTRCKHDKKIAWWREPCALCEGETRSRLDYEHLYYAERDMRDKINEALRPVGEPRWSPNFAASKIAEGVKDFVREAIKVSRIEDKT